MSTSFKQNQNYFQGSTYSYPQLSWTRCRLHKQQCPVLAHGEITSPSLPRSLSLTCLSALMSGHGSTAGGLKLLLLFHLLYVCLCIQYLCVRKLHAWSWMAVPWTRCPGRTASMLVWEPEACSHTSPLWLCWSYCLLRHHTSPGK